jgi:hypothetical protein
MFGWLRYSGYVLRLDIEEELCEAKKREGPIRILDPYLLCATRRTRMGENY